MQTRVAHYILPVVAFVLLGQGCGGSSTKTAAGPDGGVFKSTDIVEWKQLKTLVVGDKLGSIANVGTVSVALDPNDPKAIYLGTTENGLMYTLDGGTSWQNATGAGLNTGKINSIAVDPLDKCTVFLTRANQIFKTQTCLRDWNQVYFDPRTDKQFTALAVDHYNNKVVFAATNDGDIVRSDDGGQSWRPVHRVDGVQINNFVIDPRDSRVVYASTQGSGLVKTVDGGATWELIYKPLQEWDGARRVTRVYVDPSVADRIYVISKYGIIRSDDGGASFNPLTLPTPPGSIDIRSLAIHPSNSERIVYATPTSIVSSEDGGITWTPKKLPTKRGVAFLQFNGEAPSNLLLGAPPLPK